MIVDLIFALGVVTFFLLVVIMLTFFCGLIAGAVNEFIRRASK